MLKCPPVSSGGVDSHDDGSSPYEYESSTTLENPPGTSILWFDFCGLFINQPIVFPLHRVHLKKIFLKHRWRAMSHMFKIFCSSCVVPRSVITTHAHVVTTDLVTFCRSSHLPPAFMRTMEQKPLKLGRNA